MKRFLAVFKARNIEFIRDRSALAWSILVPVMLVFGFAFMFTGDAKDVFKVGVYFHDNANQRPDLEFFNTKYIQFITVTDLDSAIEKVRHHQLDMLFDNAGNYRYWVNSTSPNGYLLERLLLTTGYPAGHTPADIIPPTPCFASRFASRFERQTADGREIRYIDWLLPGILAMNMMFSCLFGVGYVIVRYRKNGVLKRLKATPVTAFEFIAAQVSSRFLIIMVITVAVYIGCNIFIDFHMLGSYWTLLLVFAVGTICLISLGLLVAARISSEEMSGGIMNLISLPMMLLSGVWFSLEGSNAFVQQLSQLMPLTHLIEAARAIMNDGAGLVEIFPNIIVLVFMSAVFLAIGSYTFKWQ